jgi:hypothetical protein
MPFEILERERDELKMRNHHGDILIIHPSLIYDTLETEEEELERLAEEENLSHEYYDFSNPGSLRKRQKDLLRRMERYKEERKKVDNLRYFKSEKMWVVILCHGGSFAFLVFDPMTGKCVTHKSDKKYVQRKKQGGRQAN